MGGANDGETRNIFASPEWTLCIKKYRPCIQQLFFATRSRPQSCYSTLKSFKAEYRLCCLGTESTVNRIQRCTDCAPLFATSNSCYSHALSCSCWNGPNYGWSGGLSMCGWLRTNSPLAPLSHTTATMSGPRQYFYRPPGLCLSNLSSNFYAANSS